MRIALLSFEYPPETGFGGIGTYTWYQARALVKLGHQVHVLAGATEPTELRRCDHDGVVVWRRRGNSRRRRALVAGLDRLGLWWTRNRLETGLDMYRGLRALCRKYRFDLVEMPECGAEGLLVNHLINIPALVKLHSPARLIMPYYEVKRLDRMLCAAAERIALAGADAVTSGSRFLATEAARALGLRPSIEVLPNGIDVELFDAEDGDARNLDRGELDLPTDRLLIFFAGRMERRKGIHLCRDVVLPILERHPVTVAFAGQDLFGYLAESLLPALDSRGLPGDARYLGRLEPAQVRAWLRRSNVFLLPSLWENCPYSCLEAMAAGCAIVSSDAGGLSELIRDGENGLLARRGDIDSHRRALERLIEDPALRRRLGDAARASVEESFSDLEIARRSVEIYRRLAATR